MPQIIKGEETIGEYTLTDTDGTAGQVLTTDGAGNVTFQDSGGGGTPAGNPGDIQFNNNGSFGGNDQFYYNGTAGLVGVNTTSPAYPLDVDGSVRVRTFNQYAFNASYLTGADPVRMAKGVFTTGGPIDLAVTNATFNNVSVFLGNGDGTFNAGVTYGVGGSPQGIATGHFTSNDYADIVATNQTDNTISVLLNNGDGTFATSVDYATGNFPISVATGDFDGTNFDDIVVSNDSDNTMSVYINNGDGTFASQVIYPTGSVPIVLAVGDFNNDGFPDVAVVNNGDKTVGIFLNNGDGTFASMVAYGIPFSISPTTITLIDIDNDGNLDIVVGDATNFASTLINDGTGVFSSGTTFSTPEFIGQLTTADMNNDGFDDIVSADFSENTVSIFLNNRDGTFSPAVSYGSNGLSPNSVVVGDFDSSGFNDIAVLNTATTNVAILLSQSTTAPTLFANALSGNVGIGTLNPITQLHLPGRIPSNPISTVLGAITISIAKAGNYVYYLDNQNDLLLVYDVTDPNNPLEVTGGSVNTNTGTTSIAIAGKYACVVNGGAPSYLQIFDISNPALPVDVSNGGVPAEDSATWVSISGNYAYILNQGSNTLQTFDVSNPANPTSVSTVATGSIPINISIYGEYLYVTNNDDGNFQIFSLANPAKPVSVSTTNTSDSPICIAVSGSYAYITEAGDALEVFDISDPANPTSPSSPAATNPNSNRITISERYVYVLNQGDNTAQIFDVSNHQVSPILLGTVKTGTFPSALVVSGRYLYVGNQDTTSSLQIFDLGGAYIQSLEVGSIEAENISLRSDIDIENANIRESVAVGQNLEVDGNSGFGGSITALGKIADPALATVATGSTPWHVDIQENYAYVVNLLGSFQVFDITNPRSMFDVSSGGVSASFPVSVAISGQYAYVPTIGDNSLTIFDISNPANPVFVSKAAVGSGPNSVTLSGKYAYVANQSDNTIQAVDVSDPHNPLPLTATSASGTGVQDIAVQGNFAYVNYFASADIEVFDISNANNIVSVTSVSSTNNSLDLVVSGRYLYNAEGDMITIWDISFAAGIALVGSITLGQAVTSLFISEKYLYAITSDGFINVIDVLNPVTPVFVQKVATGAFPFSMSVSGGYAYVLNQIDNTMSSFDLGGTYIQSLEAGTMQAEDLILRSNLQAENGDFRGGVEVGQSLHVQGDSGFGGNITAFGGVPTLLTAAATGGGPRGMKVVNNYAYVVHSTDDTFAVYDVSTGSANPISGSVATVTFPISIDVAGNYAYIVGETSNKLQIFDISDPANPVDVSQGGITTGAAPFSVSVSGKYAFVACTTASKLQVFDVSDPANIVSVAGAGIATANGAVCVTTSGNYAYVTSAFGNKLQVYDISNPNKVVQVTTGGTTTASFPLWVTVSGNYAYVVTNLGNTFQIFDVSDPTNPVELTTAGGVPCGMAPYSVFISGRYAYIASSDTNELLIFDVSNPTSPIQVGTISTGSTPKTVVVVGRYLYLTCGTSETLSIFDLQGAYVQTLEAGELRAENLQLRSRLYADHISTRNSAEIGGGLYVQGLASVGSPHLGTGTITDDTAGNITGSSTVFTTQLAAGDTIIVNGTTTIVQTITNNTTMTVSPPTTASSSDFYFISSNTTSPAMQVNGKLKVTGSIDPTFVDFAQIIQPSNPGANHDRLYFKSDDNLYKLDSSGTETQINSSTTPVIKDTIALTNQGADIADTNFSGASTIGTYRVGYYMLDTTADLTAGAVTLNIKYNDGTASRTTSSNAVILTATSGFDEGNIFIRLGTASITYGTTHTGIFGTAKYALYISLEQLS